MRIIRGKYRGKKIHVPTNFTARPTTDFAKEALFNIIENNCEIGEISILDLFSGTGSISLEFLSRGVVSAVAVELNKKYYFFLKRVGEELFPKNFSVINADAFKYIEHRSMNFDIIFADPPYDLPEIDKIPEKIINSDKINDDTLLILEHSLKYDFADNQYFREVRKYGKVHFSFFSKKR